MNNYEKIKNMTIEEMARFFKHIKNYICKLCIYNNNEYNCYSDNLSCFDGIKQWLESEVEDENS